MTILEIINNYNRSYNAKFEELILSLSDFIGQPITKGVAQMFSKDVTFKNKIVKPVYIRNENGAYGFYCGERQLFKVEKKEYNIFDTSISALRCSLIPSHYTAYIISNDQFEVGSYGLYEDFSINKDYTNYRYLSIKNTGVIEYEAFIDKEKQSMKKSYYSDDHEIVSRYYYTIKLRENISSDYSAAIEKIADFFHKEYPNLDKDEYDRYFYDIADQYFYDMKLIDKKEKFNEIYMVNGSNVFVNIPTDVIYGMSLKGKDNRNKENYLALSHPTIQDIKLLCVTDFVNGSRVNRRFKELVTEELKKWFLNLDAQTLKDEKILIASLGRKIFSINSFVTNQVLDIKENNTEFSMVVVGSAMGLALVTLRDTYIVNYGDTRVYISKDGVTFPITVDDTRVWDLYKKKEITRDEAFQYQKGSVLTNYIGNPGNFSRLPDLYKIKNNDYDKMFLFTDGVTDNINDKLVNEIVSNNKNSEVLEKIILEAHNFQERHDDVTGCCYIKR